MLMPWPLMASIVPSSFRDFCAVHDVGFWRTYGDGGGDVRYWVPGKADTSDRRLRQLRQ
jgi:hypothetical protein